MSSVEERLTRVERDVEELKRNTRSVNGKANWLFPTDDQFKEDAVLKEIFQMGKEFRDEERREETK